MFTDQFAMVVSVPRVNRNIHGCLLGSPPHQVSRVDRIFALESIYFSRGVIVLFQLVSSTPMDIVSSDYSIPNNTTRLFVVQC